LWFFAPIRCFPTVDRAVCVIIGDVKLNIARPSADAPQSMALYEKLRSIGEDADTKDGEQALLAEIISGLFTIVAGLEAERRAD
jgi:hypothetical protein